jgi:thioredoxin-related protein
MKREASIFILLFIIFLSAFTYGCTSGNNKQEALSQNSDLRIGFDQAYSSLITNTDYSKSNPIHVYYIKGTDLDSRADAKEWIFGIQQDATPYFYIYRSGGGTITTWPWDIPYQEIAINDTFLSPADLFSQHKLFLEDITSTNTQTIDELELVNGTYSLTITNNSSSTVYLYDRTTGKEIV